VIYLLDTCAFLWWCLEPQRVPAATRTLLEDGTNEVLLSAASCWEIVIKHGLGRLELPTTPAAFVLDEVQANHFKTVPISPSHTFAVERLPDIHRDPFDRILVAQAVCEHATLVTDDATIAQYRVTTVWE
jgi:PIN domain nuclease of toxin-antitoxin system